MHNFMGAEANEFYFQGHSKSQAPWRFHEDNNQREYRLKVRKTKALWFRWPIRLSRT